VEVFVREWQKAFSSAIIAIHEDSVELKTEQLLSQSSPHPIHVIAPIIKFSRLELLVEKCVELGASSIRLYQAEHARPDAKFESLKKRCLRLEKIRDQALKQSRSVCNTQLQYFENLALSSPIMEEIVGIGLVLVSEKDALSLASPGNYRAFSSLLREFMKIKKSNKNDDLYLCVGPEGGFSKSELSCLEQKRFQATSLGPNVFRTETAAIAATAIACELLE
jgi:16S rRNA (uracil1498-N3)-methyltransferase